MEEARRSWMWMIAALALAIVASMAAPAAAQRRSATVSAGDVDAGRESFARRCGGCHRGEGAGGSYLPQGPEPSRMHVDEARARHIVRNGVRNEGMPAFSRSRIGDRELDSLVAYLRSAGGIR